MRISISEKEILSVIEDVLSENRKVIKVGSPAPMPASVPPMTPAEDGMGGGMPPMDGGAGAPPADNMSGGADVPPADDMGGGSEFDTNFDAGVEADEETDPVHYIQQLTGKLSQSLNSYNNEQGPDAGLCKYVASMIIAAACKNLDEKAKKELIEKINTAQSDDEDTAEGGEDMGAEEMPDDMGGEGNGEAPMMEGTTYTKKQLKEFLIGKKSPSDNEPRPADAVKRKENNNIPKAWKGKSPINGSVKK